MHPIYATWHDNTPGNYEIYYRVRTGSSWSATQNLSNSPASSTYPCLGGPVNNAPVALWVENVSGNNEIKYAWVGQASSGLLATTPGPSSYPTFTTRSIAGGTRILGLWTEGSASPYFIQDSFVDLVPLAKPWVEEERHAGVPPAFVLHPSYPNPFNPASTIQYDLPEAALVQLVILNMLGQEVARLVEGWQPAGRYQVNWRSGGHPSGVYFCHLRAGEFVATRKMNLLH
ncbi:MAG: T9SS type A sorting domain-containing protein [candidate division KSB1 bacterium]|nr:T9SS type A sorting domain-containing protein [candidate division KSB1 bacterium]MDZ7350900.1 T9SS type A sorting domain-containing protein [candidate division KSB1 bacterium]MDZ7383848.1 T9SS type A sorting domain-containing protein [candidate division KSB1 bacterium]MDZ7397977.1 T9SS type A sorting domain-containing protein [candidate division KSB1 bacterium]MDZ7411868.1 T9SS type A sorting domain-containing protein [candidate division KSB1 bacterium]